MAEEEGDTAKSGRDDAFWSNVSEALRKGSATASQVLPSGDQAAEAMRSAAITLGDGYWDRDGQWKRFDRHSFKPGISEELWNLKCDKFNQEFADQEAGSRQLGESLAKIVDRKRLEKSLQELSAKRINKKLEEQRRKILENL